MSKKLIAGSVLALALFAFSGTEAASTVKFGMKNADVTALQTALKVTPATGYFGNITLAAVKAFQTAHGLTADGVVGPKTWAAIAGSTTTTTGTTTTTTTSTTLSGGAGDAEMTHYSTSEKSSFGEGEENVKVLGFKVEAIDSDVALTNVKVKFMETTGDASYKLSNYVDSVEVYKGSTKVGSADASDFTKTTTDGPYYTKSITLSNAVVKDGDKDAFYVVVNATDSIDTDDEDGSFDVEITSFRFQDATGVVSTLDASGITNSVDIDTAGADDGASLKASSANPSDVTVTVDENDTTDDVLALAFKMDADDDSSDITLTSLPITLSFVDPGTTSSDNVIESVKVKIGSDEFDADATDSTISASGTSTATYTVDLDGEDVVLGGGDVTEVKVYITFAEQDGNYASTGVKVTASVSAAAIDAETDSDDTFTFDTGSKAGGEMTLSLSKTTVDVTSTDSSKNDSDTIGTFTFKVSVEANDEDVTLDSSAFETVVIGGTATPSFSIVKNSGTATTVTAGEEYTVADGNTATFTVTFTVDPSTSGTYYVQLDTVAGVTVDETAGPETLVAA